VLGFVGVKMLAMSVVHVPIWASLAVICGTLLGAVVLSVLRERRKAPHAPTPDPAEAR